MINTIIFDIGNVLMKFDSFSFLKEILGDDIAVDHVFSAIFHTDYWDELDLGLDPEEVFLKMISNDPAYEKEIRLTLANLDKGLYRADYARDWIKELKARGYRILYLSNYSEFIMDIRWDVLNFLPLMDGGIFSCYEGMIKPDPAIFKRLFDRYDLDPKECVFIDDNADNIRTAGSLGLNTVHFKGYETAREELEDILAGA